MDVRNDGVIVGANPIVQEPSGVYEALSGLLDEPDIRQAVDRQEVPFVRWLRDDELMIFQQPRRFTEL